MLDPVIYSSQLARKLQDRNEMRHLYLLENILIINKKPGLQSVNRQFDLTSMHCQIIWRYENNLLQEMILYDARLNQKKVYFSTPDKLFELQSKLNGRVFQRNFQQFYQKIQVIKVHKNVEIVLCKSTLTLELKVAKIVKLDESDNNYLIRNEAKIFQKLSYHPHPQVLGADQIFIQDSCVIYVMSYCTGGTLIEFLCENELSLPDQTTRGIMKNLLEGLSHLHKLGIVHRDIKLDNVMLEKKNDYRGIKIIDFGFSTFVDTLKVNEQRCGTPGYIAPEVLKLEDYNELCDIYSLGCIFHALLTGRKIQQTPKSTKASNLEVLSKNIKISLSQICSIDALDLLQEMISALKFRPNAVQCLQHQYFEEELFIIEEFNTKLVKLEFPQFKNPFNKQ